MGWVKIQGRDGKIYLCSALTEPDEVMNHLLEQYDEKPEETIVMIELHKVAPIIIITGNENIPYDENIHCNL